METRYQTNKLSLDSIITRYFDECVY